ncbi:MAG: ABC transporter ATP-binding protein [Oscillospiraceae bacterium]|nr:ABC transporter ATP-binding protein [Oscillospiraceae bacterium]
MALIDVNNINYFYQDGDIKRYILNNISYSFERGKFYTIFGESGSGKTTFLAILSALDQPKSGNVCYEGVDINKIGLNTYRRNKISIIFQQYNLVPYMTAVENVRTVMSITDNTLPSDLNEVAYNLLDYIGITKDRADRVVNKLSGGEQQRVAIARALATNVDVILADEPTGNLDGEMESEIVQIFKKLAHEHNKCIIVVSHSSQIAAEADEVITLKKGRFEPHNNANSPSTESTDSAVNE